jgi:hypothetical protein
MFSRPGTNPGFASTATAWLLSVILLGATPSLARSDESATFREIDWMDLLTEADIAALSNPPDWLAEIDNGSDEDNLGQMSVWDDDSPFGPLRMVVSCSDLLFFAAAPDPCRQ